VKGRGGRYRDRKEQDATDDPESAAEPGIPGETPPEKIYGERNECKDQNSEIERGKRIQKKNRQKDECRKLPNIEEESENNERRDHKIAAHAGWREPELQHDGEGENKNGRKMFHEK
jgi:hypothetical protein